MLLTSPPKVNDQTITTGLPTWYRRSLYAGVHYPGYASDRHLLSRRIGRPIDTAELMSAAISHRLGRCRAAAIAVPIDDDAIITSIIRRTRYDWQVRDGDHSITLVVYPWASADASLYREVS